MLKKPQLSGSHLAPASASASAPASAAAPSQSVATFSMRDPSLLRALAASGELCIANRTSMSDRASSSGRERGLPVGSRPMASGAQSARPSQAESAAAGRDSFPVPTRVVFHPGADFWDIVRREVAKKQAEQTTRALSPTNAEYGPPGTAGALAEETQRQARDLAEQPRKEEKLTCKKSPEEKNAPDKKARAKEQRMREQERYASFGSDSFHGGAVTAPEQLSGEESGEECAQAYGRSARR